MHVQTIDHKNYTQEVLQSSQPVLLDFWAPWCTPCRMVAPILEQIAAERPDIKVGKVNIDEQPALANRFRIMSIPTLVVLKDGQIVNQVVGARPKDAILSLLQ